MFLGCFCIQVSFVIPFVILYVHVFYAYISDCHQVWLNLLLSQLVSLFLVSASNVKDSLGKRRASLGTIRELSWVEEVMHHCYHCYL